MNVLKKTHAYDPNVKDTILKIIETFRRKMRTRLPARWRHSPRLGNTDDLNKPRGHGIASRGT